MGLKYVLLAIFILEKIFRIVLKIMNTAYAKKHHDIPDQFKKKIDKKTTEKQLAYLSARTRFRLVELIFETVVIAIFFFSPLYEVYNTWILSLDLSFMLTGKLFIFIILAASTIFGIPFSLYFVFKIEKSFGFSTMTFGLWLLDFFKSIGISILIMSIITTTGFWAIQVSPDYWWLIIWGFFCVFSLFLLFIFPYILAPLFFKLSPLEDKPLLDKISHMTQKVGLKMKQVWIIDVSRRSNHVNAFFTGLGKSRHIVLYDTMLEKLSHDELIAILSHEAGHWKCRHTLKHLLTLQVLSLPVLYLAFRILQSNILKQTLGMPDMTVIAGIIFVGFLYSLVSFFFKPVFSYISRRNEFRADDYTTKMTGSGKDLACALLELSHDNLSNLHPHPLFWKWYYSHPPTIIRVKRLIGNEC